MTTYNTTLCLVNLSGFGITSTDVTIADPEDWDYVNKKDPKKMNRPDLNFTGPLAYGDARCEREEINAGSDKGCKFGLTVTFDNANKSQLNFDADQWDSTNSTQLRDTVTSVHFQTAHGDYELEVYRITGMDRYVYYQAFYLRPHFQPDNSDWMGHLQTVQPRVLLNQITMPGSHDAGMYTDVMLDSRTQKLSFKDQLRAGVRYFDVRVCENQGLWTWHGTHYGGKLDDILADVKTFIQAHGREAVFLKFRSYASGDQKDTLDLVKTTLGNLLYKEATPNFAQTPLEKLAGHVIAAFHPDYGLTAQNGVDGTHPYRDFGNEDTGAFIPPGPGDELSLGVYDCYTDENDFSVMAPDQVKKLDNFGGYGKEYLFLLSWTLTGMRTLFNLQLLSATANAQMPQALHQIETGSKPLPNIVYLDWVDPYLCTRVIAVNPGIGPVWPAGM
jgi:hypothetical protein